MAEPPPPNVKKKKTDRHPGTRRPKRSPPPVVSTASAPRVGALPVVHPRNVAAQVVPPRKLRPTRRARKPLPRHVHRADVAGEVVGRAKRRVTPAAAARRHRAAVRAEAPVHRLGVPLDGTRVQEPLLTVRARVVARDGVRAVTAAAATAAAAAAAHLKWPVVVRAGAIVPLLVVGLPVGAVGRRCRRRVTSVPRASPAAGAAATGRRRASPPPPPSPVRARHGALV